MPSDDFYQSTGWKAKRQQRLAIDGHTCQGCGITAAQLEQLGWSRLQVHHKNAGPPDYGYPSFGNEQPSDLLTLCETCHDGITDSVRKQRFKLDPKKQVLTRYLEGELSHLRYSNSIIPRTYRVDADKT